MRMKVDEWQSVVDTNLNSMFRVTKSCLKGMTKARWGRIINISSVVGACGNPGQTNYAASKAGIEGFTRSLAKEIGSRGVTVNSVAPGFIDTDMTSSLAETQVDSLLAQIPLRRLGTPEEIASVVRFLVSERANYITGETINIDGGWGWVVCFSGFLCNIISFGIFMTFGIFLEPLMEHYKSTHR